MPCPFPGMDPYLERPQIWPDFHDRLITHIAESLQPLLRPRYAALTRERLYVVEHERPIWPDVSVIQAGKFPGNGGSSTAVAIDTDEPIVIELVREEVREPVIHIIEAAAGNRIVTSIEVLSPDNKAPGAGRDSYVKKRDELWSSGAHLVEIDLLRGGELTVRVSKEKLESLAPWRYLVAVSRQTPPRYELYPFPLEQRFPRIAIPLSVEDPDIPLDLQAVFARCWNAGPYPVLLHYDHPPPEDLTAEERDWCGQKIADMNREMSDYEGPENSVNSS